MALISRITLFLGQPACTIAAVLGGLLVTTGVGSALAGRFASPAALPGVLAGLLGVEVLVSLGVPYVLEATLGLPFRGRLGVVFLLLPLGILLGMPFPLGLSRLGSRAPDLVPWARWPVDSSLSASREESGKS